MTVRQREKNQTVPKSARIWNYNNSLNVTVPEPRHGIFSSMWDTVTPNFRKRSREGAIINNPMWSVTSTYSSDCEGYYIYYGTPDKWEQTEPRPGLLVGGEESNAKPIVAPMINVLKQDVVRDAEVEATTKCLSDIGRSQANTWENLAEVRKTLSLLRHPIASWSKWNEKTPLTSTGSASANAYLLYRYGISPLVRDVNEIMTQAFRSVKPLRRTTRSSAVAATSSSQDITVTGTHNITYRIQKTESLLVRCASVDEVIADWAYTYGLSRKQLTTLWWELIPYSFVVDWLGNVGDCIGALANAFESESLGRSVSRRITYSQVGTFVNYWYSGTATVVRPFRGWARLDQVNKDRYPGFSTGPGLVIKQNLRFDDATRVADAVALVAQQFTRRARAVEKLFLSGR